MEHVDTIVVGGGAAGCVVASRLSEDPDRSVVLLEAGPDHADPRQLPDELADGRQNALRDHLWDLRHRVNSRHRWVRFPFPRGRVVGGSSAVNTCIAIRGQPYDYDRWADRGLPEWTWARCLPAFRRLERDLDFPDHPEHGADGPLPLKRPDPATWAPWSAAFVEAAEALGFARCDDTNRAGSTGVGAHAMNAIDGRRVSAAEAWLDATVRARPGLSIRGGHHVLRIRFDGRRAVGVDVRRDGAVHTLHADRVVLAAGAVHTPGLLLRSGVGPAGELARLGVPRVADVPGVGHQLLDHPGCAIFLRPRAGVSRRDLPVIQTALRYQGSGSPFPADMQMQPGAKCPFPPPLPTLPWVSLMAHVGKPAGVGRIRWDSADPDARPRIDSALLDHPDDRRLAVEAMLLAWELAHTRPLRDLVAAPLWPSRRGFRSRAAVDRWIRRATDSGYHPCGTVPMGPDDDPWAATDGRGRVRGTEGLVVADASLFPEVPSANTHLPVLMVAERVAAWLRED